MSREFRDAYLKEFPVLLPSGSDRAQRIRFCPQGSIYIRYIKEVIGHQEFRKNVECLTIFGILRGFNVIRKEFRGLRKLDLLFWEDEEVRRVGNGITVGAGMLGHLEQLKGWLLDYMEEKGSSYVVPGIELIFASGLIESSTAPHAHASPHSLAIKLAEPPRYHRIEEKRLSPHALHVNAKNLPS